MHASTLLLITNYSYVGILVSLSLGIIGLPIPDESLIAFTAFLSSQGKLNLFLLLPVIICGAFLGITISFILGRLSRSYVFPKFTDKLSIDADRLQAVKTFYDKYGGFTLFFGYFVPGVRHLTAIFAGINYMPYRRFAIFAYTGGLLWIAVFFSLGYFLGQEWHYISRYSNRFFIPIIILLSLALFLFRYLRQKH